MKARVKLAVSLGVVMALLLGGSDVGGAFPRNDRSEKFAGVANVKVLNIICRGDDSDKGKSTVRLKIKVTRKIRGVKFGRLGDDNGWGDRGHIKAVFPGGSLVLHRFENFVSFPKGFKFPRPDRGRETFSIRLFPFKRFHGVYRPVGGDSGLIIIKLRCVKPAS